MQDIYNDSKTILNSKWNWELKFLIPFKMPMLGTIMQIIESTSNLEIPKYHVNVYIFVSTHMRITTTI